MQCIIPNIVAFGLHADVGVYGGYEFRTVSAAGSCSNHSRCLLQPVFGAGFNSEGGFAAFSGAAGGAPKAEEGDGDDGDEEECKAEFTPLVQLDEVEKTTGEENEELLLELCASIFLTISVPCLAVLLTCTKHNRPPYS